MGAGDEDAAFDEGEEDDGIEVDPETGEVLDLDGPLSPISVKQAPAKRSTSVMSGALKMTCFCRASNPGLEGVQALIASVY